MLKQLLKHPLIISLITLLLGSGIFDTISENRKNEEFKKQKAIELLDNVDKRFFIVFNKAFNINDQNCSSIKQSDPQTIKLLSEDIHKSIDSLGQFLGTVKVNAAAYLNDKRFKDKLVTLYLALYNYNKYCYQHITNTDPNKTLQKKITNQITLVNKELQLKNPYVKPVNCDLFRMFLTIRRGYDETIKTELLEQLD